MSKQSTAILFGTFGKPFSGKKDPSSLFVNFDAGKTEHFLTIDHTDKIPVNVPVKVTFNLRHENIIQNGKIAGILKPANIVRIDTVDK